jgi:hypothetical protein
MSLHHVVYWDTHSLTEEDQSLTFVYFQVRDSEDVVTLTYAGNGVEGGSLNFGKNIEKGADLSIELP